MRKVFVFICALVVLSSCGKQDECPYRKGCVLPGEPFYLIEHALVFRSMELCKQRLEERIKAYDVRVNVRYEPVKNELYEVGGYGKDQQEFKFLCQDPFHQDGVFFYTTVKIDQKSEQSQSITEP